MTSALASLHGLVTDSDDAQAGRQHEPFLRAGYRNIDTPFFHPEFDSADGTDTIHEKQCRMIEVIQYLANASNVACHTSGSLVMAGQNSLNTMMPVSFELATIQIQRNTLAPVEIKILHIEIETATHFHP